MKKLTFILVCLILIIISPPILSAEEIAEVRISGLTTISEEKVREVIGIKGGDIYSAGAIEDAKENLRKWGVFDEIEVSQSPTPSGTVVSFQLREAMVVVSINIEGNYPYIENKIRKHLSLHPGDIFTPDVLSKEVDRIKAFYAREGFVGTEVFVNEDHLPEWGGVVLTFHIRRGDAIRYGRINVEGNRAFKKGRIISAINPYRQFSERRLTDSLRRLKEFYREKGYPKARIWVRDKRIVFDPGRVDLSLGVSEGPHVEVVFRGAPRLSRKLLRRTITILKEGSIDEYEIENSVEALRNLFRERGYPDAKIETTKTETKDGAIVVSFKIDEGGGKWIKHLEFSGNEHVRARDLAKDMKNRGIISGRQSPYSPDEIPSDNEAILKAMRRHGFLNAHVGEWEVGPTKQGYALDVTVPVEEGPQTIVGEVSFAGNDAFDVARLLGETKIVPGKPFDEPGLAEDLGRLKGFYADNGFPYADVKQTWRLGDTGQAIVHYDISEGGQVHIGQILIMGDVLTSQKAIKHAMDIKEGDVFSLRKIIDSQLSIRRLGAFTAVNIETIGLEDHKPTVHLKVKVEEQRPFQVDLGVGYSTDERLTGSLTFTNLNAFGWAKSNSLRLVAGTRLSRAELGWFDPRFLSSSFEMSSIGWIQYRKKPAFAFTQLGGSLGWFRRFKRFGFFFRYEIDRNYLLSGSSVAADADSLRNNTVSRITLSSSYDSRDSFSDPKRGFFTVGGADIFNEIKGNRANFVKLYWQGENDLGFLGRFVISTALRFNRIQTIGRGVSVPTNELLFLGGDDTIRGFSEDSLGPADASGNATGARIRWIWNEELRIRIGSNFDLAGFYDMGSLTNNFGDITTTTIRNSIGLGLRYITPVGPIRADYGFKLDRKSGEPRGRFHFTFGYVF